MLWGDKSGDELDPFFEKALTLPVSRLSPRPAAAFFIRLSARKPIEDYFPLIQKIWFPGDPKSLKKDIIIGQARFLGDLCSSMILLGHEDLAAEIFAKAKASFGDVWEQETVYQAVFHAILAPAYETIGDFASANASYKLVQEALTTMPKTEARHFGHGGARGIDLKVGTTSIAGNAERRILAAPETAQAFREIEEAIDRGEPGESLNARLYRFLRKNGPEPMNTEAGMQTVSTGLLQAVKAKEGLEDSLRAYITRRLKAQIERAIVTGDDHVLEGLLAEFSGFIEDAEIREALMAMHMDRGDFNGAYRHATRLIDHPEKGATAAAHVLSIESAVGIGDAQRAIFTPAQLAKTVTWRGKTMTVKALRDGLGLSDPQAAERAAVPGTQLGVVSFPGKVRNRTLPRNEGVGHGLAETAREIEMVPYGDSVVITHPWFAIGIDTKTGREAWRKILQDGPAWNRSIFGANTRRMVGYASGDEFYAFMGVEGVEGHHLLALGKDGRTRWQSVDDPHLGEQELLGTLLGGGGWQQTFALSSGRSNVRSLSLIPFDVSSRTFGEPRPLHRVKNLLNRNAGVSVDDVRFNQNSFYDSKHLILASGCGSLMGVNLGQGRLSWVTTWNEAQMGRGLQDRSGASYLAKVHGDFVAYLPDLLTWAGVDPSSGAIRWQHREFFVPESIHSRGSTSFVIGSGRPPEGERHLFSLDPKTGGVLWGRGLNGMQVSGEGVVQGGRVYVPCESSFQLFDAATGKHLGGRAMPYRVTKIRVFGNRWYFFSDDAVYVYDSKGTFAPSVPVASPPITKPVVAAPATPVPSAGTNVVETSPTPASGTNAVATVPKTGASPVQAEGTPWSVREMGYQGGIQVPIRVARLLHQSQAVSTEVAGRTLMFNDGAAMVVREPGRDSGPEVLWTRSDREMKPTSTGHYAWKLFSFGAKGWTPDRYRGPS